MPKPVYFDTSIFIEMGTKRSKYATKLRTLLKDLHDRKIRIYTSILTVQELSVAAHRKGTLARDTMGDVHAIARVATITKEIALTAAKREAELKDIAEDNEKKRDKKKPLTKEQEIERICENRRRKWDCIHIATAQALGCSTIYSTDADLQKRPKQLGIKHLEIISPPESMKKVTGPLIDFAAQSEPE